MKHGTGGGRVTGTGGGTGGIRRGGGNKGGGGRIGDGGSGFHHAGTISLADAPAGRDLEIVSLLRGHGMQFRLRNLGLSEGRTIRKVSSVAWGGPVVVAIQRSQIAVGRGMARNVLVRPL